MNVTTIPETRALSQEMIPGIVPVLLRGLRRVGGWAVVPVTLMIAVLAYPAHASGDTQTRFKPMRTQFIAALGDPDASSGTGAQSWGLWREDPGPRAVWLSDYEQLETAGGITPAGWQFQPAAWWLEENGRIMEQPEFGVPPGRYVVTGNRQVTSVLTIHAPDADGNQRWELKNGATLHDVTHLGCRSALYTPAADGDSCSPAEAQKTDFPVQPGAAMPAVQGCHKQDYQVLIVIGRIVDD